jgi:hypothetical protein
MLATHLPNTPVLLIFIVAWLILKLVDCIQNFPAGPPVFAIIRLVTVIVALVLVLLPIPL